MGAAKMAEIPTGGRSIPRHNVEDFLIKVVHISGDIEKLIFEVSIRLIVRPSNSLPVKSVAKINHTRTVLVHKLILQVGRFS